MATTRMQLVDWLDDLCVRFIVNLPNEELASPERICFQVEEAQWFYEDFIRPLDPTLPSLNLRKFCELIFQHCPLLSAHAELAATAYSNFLEYKTRVPVRGAIMVNEAMDHVVLVKGWKKGARWSFPRGKINKDENDLDCAVREVYEETGLHLGEAGLVKAEKDMKYIEVNMREQQLRLYVFRGVPEDTYFEPRTRKEISKIQWYRIGDLPTQRKGVVSGETDQNRFYMVAPFIGQLKRWIREQRQADKAKAYSSHYLVPDNEPETAGELTADEDITQAEAVADMARLHSLLARGGIGMSQISNVQPHPDDENALKQLLGLGAPLPYMNETNPQEQQKSNLLALFKGTTNAPPALSQMPSHTNTMQPHTPFEQLIQQPPEAQTPPHHHPRQMNLSHGPPPVFPYPAAQALQSQQPHISGHLYPAHSQAGLVQNPPFGVHGMAPPPSFGLPPHPVQHQQWNGPTPATYNGTLPNPQSIPTQTPSYPNVQGMAVPKAANLPKPKFNPQSHGGRHHNHRSQPSTGFAHHPNAVLDKSDPFMKKASRAPANPAQHAQPPTQESQVSQGIMHNASQVPPPAPDAPTYQPRSGSEAVVLPPRSLGTEHQNSLLNLFHSSNQPQQIQTAPLPPVPAELPGDSGTQEQLNGPPRKGSQLHNEAHDKLLDLFKMDSSHIIPVEAIHTPDNGGSAEESHIPLTNRRLSARRSYSKGASSLPQPVMSILQRPVGSPHRQGSEVRPPSTPLHTVKNTTPMQAPKPFNPQILKRPAQLENAANAPLPAPTPPVVPSSEKEVQSIQQQISLLGLLGGLSPVHQPDRGDSSGSQQAQQHIHSQGIPVHAPPPYQQQDTFHDQSPRNHNVEQQNALLGLFNDPSATQNTWANAHNHTTQAPAQFTHPNQFHQNQHSHPHVPPMDRTPLVEFPANPPPPHNPPAELYHHDSHMPQVQQVQPVQQFSSNNGNFVDTRARQAKDQKANLLSHFRPSPTSGLSHLSQLNTNTEADLVSPLDHSSRSRVGSFPISVDHRRGGGSAVETAENGRRGSGMSSMGGIERRESGLQTPKTPNREFLLGFLEGVAKGAK